MKVGDEIKIIKEPTNEHDSNAIAIYYNSIHIGYIPKEENVAFGVLMEQGIISKAEIVSLNKGGSVREPCKIGFYATLEKKQ